MKGKSGKKKAGHGKVASTKKVTSDEKAASYGPYTKKLIEHFRNPHNMGRMKDADAVGKVGNPICGDVLYMYIKVGIKPSGKLFIKDISFESFGCAAAVAVGSMTTELAKGKTLEAALKISRTDVENSLGKLPPVKKHCSLLASDALHEAIYQYYKKNNMPIPEELEKTHKRIERESEIAEDIHK